MEVQAPRLATSRLVSFVETNGLLALDRARIGGRSRSGQVTAMDTFGELIPVGGGDPIPLLKKSLLVGRRESCDICLRFANVSAHHCQLTVNGGYWYIRDLNSRNGVRVNNVKVTEKRIDPGDQVRISKHVYEMRYSPIDLGAVGPPPSDEMPSDVAQEIMGTSLLERAGLESPKPNQAEPKRYDPSDDSAGQIKDPNRPL